MSVLLCKQHSSSGTGTFPILQSFILGIDGFSWWLMICYCGANLTTLSEHVNTLKKHPGRPTCVVKHSRRPAGRRTSRSGRPASPSSPAPCWCCLSGWLWPRWPDSARGPLESTRRGSAREGSWHPARNDDTSVVKRSSEVPICVALIFTSPVQVIGK